MKIVKIVHFLVDNFFEIFFPKEKRLEFLEKFELNYLKNKVRIKKHNKCFYLFNYKDEIIKDLIWFLKFKGQIGFAKFFGEILAEKLDNILDLEENLKVKNQEFLLIPIPIHRKRRRERGFNQTELICEVLIKKFDKLKLEKEITYNIKYDPSILERTKYTEKQSWNSKKDRQKNSTGVFAIKSDRHNEIKNKKIILFDDVVTTGSTLEEASRTLLESGASKIITIAIAH